MSAIRLPVLAPRPAPPRAAAVTPAPGGPFVDGLGRRVSYLRVSVTDRCNYRCTYCMPGEVDHRPRPELLTFEELVRLVGVFAGLGVRRVRLTGGEPTVRREVVELVRKLAGLAGIDAVVMTSNGHRLPELAAPLAAAGLRGVNVSVDSLEPARFARITGGGDLGRVLAGVDAARAAGLTVKLNAVALAGVNEDEVPALCEAAWARGTVTRFIEPMPMSGGALYDPARLLTAARIRAAVERAFGPLEPADDPAGRAHHGPARYWRLVDDPRREVGIISAMSEHFCDRCNRLRLTADGALHACLGHDDAVSLRDVLRSGGGDDDVQAAIAGALGAKRAGHGFLVGGEGGPAKHMVAIGG
jgi:cyclic pyranopterin phosphate synthase